MKLLYYITSHGYGHAARTATICNLLSPDTEILFRTTVPREFFAEEIRRPFTYAPAEFDCGCRQTDGVTVDVEETLSAYRSIAGRNTGLLDTEAAWCAKNGISVIASDIVPFAFEVARAAGIPSVAATSFTWYSIYEDYAAGRPEFAPYLDKIREQYALADLLLALFPACPMPYFPAAVNVGPVGRVGTDIRRRLLEENGIASDKRLGLIYTGNFGMDGAAWKDLERFGEWEFFGLYPLPGAPKNYHRIAKNLFRYQDCIASADVMISKLGYGTCAECLLNGLPMIYLPRDGFAEFPVLHAALSDWGHGYLLSKDNFYSLAWSDALDAVQRRGKPAPLPPGAALTCAREIEKLGSSPPSHFA